MITTGSFEAFIAAHPLVFVAILVWSLAWKALALWKAARIGHKTWFTALLIVNLLGVPEIIYLLFVARKFKVESSEAS